MIAVSELFGPTVQGEGPHAGRPASFLRLARCNLACSWCDTPYSWDWTRFDPAVEVHQLDEFDVADQLHRFGPSLVIVTGGEPLLQQRALAVVARALLLDDHVVEVETNGTREPSVELAVLVNLFVVSPKLANAGMPKRKTIYPDVLGAFDRLPAILKFVVADPVELLEVEAIAALAPNLPVWIMPEGRDPQTLNDRIAALADPVAERGWNLTNRLHVIAWGNQRGH